MKKMPKLTDKIIQQAKRKMGIREIGYLQHSLYFRDSDKYRNIQIPPQPSSQSIHIGISENPRPIKTGVTDSYKGTDQSIERFGYLRFDRNLEHAKTVFDDCVTWTIETDRLKTFPVDDVFSKYRSRFRIKRFEKRASPTTKSHETDIKQLKEKFTVLADNWHQESDCLSSPKKITENGNYHSIISLGIQVIPFILQDLKERGGLWYLALRRLSNEDPVSVEDRGDIQKMKNAWLRWGKRKGYTK
jgi:hypothetical protein